MILETCRRGLHPLRRFEERRSGPDGPHGVVTTYIHATCWFCEHSDRLFILGSAHGYAAGHLRRKAYSHHDMRSALAKLRASRRAFLRDAKRKAKGSVQC